MPPSAAEGGVGARAAFLLIGWAGGFGPKALSESVPDLLAAMLLDGCKTRDGL